MWFLNGDASPKPIGFSNGQKRLGQKYFSKKRQVFWFFGFSSLSRHKHVTTFVGSPHPCKHKIDFCLTAQPFCKKKFTRGLCLHHRKWSAFSMPFFPEAFAKLERCVSRHIRPRRILWHMSGGNRMWFENHDQVSGLHTKILRKWSINASSPRFYKTIVNRTETRI
jgi:hypothetical protein